jgi:DNA-binding NarL/FixJ family response regulator
MIDEASNGQELLEKLKTATPDLMIVDISMRGFILKEEADIDLHHAIEHIFAGKTYSSPLMTNP